MHLAVAPVGSVLLAVAVGADVEAVDDFAAAAGAAARAAAAGAAAGAGDAAVAGAAAGASNAGLLLEGFCTPPWPLHAPRPVAMEVVPSLQVVGVPDAAGAAGTAGAAAGSAGAAAAALSVAAFCTPPWPLHAPLPVAVEVVPSLHVVGAPESAARTGSPSMNTIKGTARNPARIVFFMDLTPWFDSSGRRIVNRFAVSSLVLQCPAEVGKIVVTFITNGVCWRPDPA